MKKILFFIALIISGGVYGQNISAVSPSGHTLYYHINGNTATVTDPRYNTDMGSSNYYPWDGHTVLSGDVVIPDSVTYGPNTYPVVQIAAGAFSGCNEITSINMPNIIESIGSSAFQRCGSLLTINLPDSLSTISSYCFASCYALSELLLPNTIRIIGQYAFSACRSLQNIILPDRISMISEAAFDGCSNLEAITIPNSVVTIGDYAFNDCSSLSHLIIGNSVTDISAYAFYGCTSLDSITIPDSVLTIGNHAFYNCTNLSHVVMGNSVTGIGASAFFGCTSLESITIPDSVLSIEDMAFYNCTNLSRVTFGANLAQIGMSAFDGCHGIDQIVLLGEEPPHGGSFETGISPIIFVPCGTVETYLSMYPWGSIGVIFENPDADCDEIVVGNAADSSCTIPFQAESLYSTSEYLYCASEIGKGGIVDTLWFNVAATGNFAVERIRIYMGHTSSHNLSGGWENLSDLQEVYFSNNQTIATSLGWEEYPLHTPFEYDGTSSLLLVVVHTSDNTTSMPKYYNHSTVYSSSVWRASDNYSDSCASLAPTPCGVISNVRPDIKLSFDLPYSTSFENSTQMYGWEYVNANQTNHWMVGTDVASAGSRSLYITNNNSSNQYTVSSASFVCAYKVLDLESGVYSFSYDWRCYGETIHDYLRVALVPDSIDFEISYAPSGFSYNALPPGWISLDGGKLNLQSAWQHNECQINIPHEGKWKLSLLWKNNASYGRMPPAAVDGISVRKLAHPIPVSIVGFSENELYGTVQGSDTVGYGQNVVLEAMPNYGYVFAGWSDGVTTNPRTIVADTNMSLFAYFIPARFTLTLSCNSNEGSVSGGIIADYNTSHIIRAIPNRGFYFVRWSDGNYFNPRTITLTEDVSLSAIFACHQYTVTGASADTMMGAVDGTSTQNYGTSVVLTAIPNYGCHFTHWNDGSTDNPRVVQVDSNVIYTAHFAYNQYTVTALSADTVMGMVSGTSTQDYMTTVVLTAMSNYGYHFVQWNDGSLDNPRIVQVDSNVAYTASFAYNQYSVTGESSDTVRGVVEGSSMQNYLAFVVLTAIPNYGYHFSQWNDGLTDNPRTVQVDSNVTYTANFGFNRYTVTGESSDTVMGEVVGTATQDYLTTVILTATPNYGYHFTQWNDGSTNNPRTVQVEGDMLYVALFGYNQYTVRGISADTSQGVVLGTSTEDYLTNVTLTAVPMTGCHFLQWNDGNSQNPRTVTADSNKVFVAQFARNRYQVRAETLTPNRGSVSGSGVFDYNTFDTIVAVSNYGYYFSQWSDGDTTNPRVLQVASDTLIFAIFERNTYVISGGCDTNMGNVVGVQVAHYLDTVMITAISKYGYHFTQWGDGCTDNPRYIQVIQDMHYSAHFASNSYTIGANSQNIDMGNVLGGGSYVYLTNVSLTAIPNYGYHFTQWSDGDTNNPRVLQVTQDFNITAQFASNIYSLASLSQDSVKGTVSGSGNYSYHTNVTLNAMANYGYHFIQWNDGNTDNPRTVIIEQDTVIVAQFGNNTYTVSVVSNDTAVGYVSSGGIYDYLDTVLVTATVVASHYEFIGWSDGVMDNPRIVVVTQDTNITAMFDLTGYTINVLSNDSVAGGVLGSGVYTYPQTVVIEATANDGYFFGGWSDGSVINPRTIVVDSSMEIEAWFYQKPELCMVSVEDGFNEVSWEKLDTVSTYNIYREGVSNGQFELVASVDYNQNPVWVDIGSNPNAHSYKYKISGISSLGVESDMSEYHKTMHLTISRGIGNNWNLIWTAYEGVGYQTYRIYRGSNSNDLTLVEEISSNGNSTFTDNTSQVPAYYQIGIVLENSCGMEKTSQEILSNITFENANGIGSSVVTPYSITTLGHTVVINGEGNDKVRIFDNLGRAIVVGFHYGGTSVFAVPSSGVYLVQIGEYPVQKIIILR